MADDYQALGLNSRLQAVDSPIANFQYTSGYDFDSLYEVQSNRIRSSNISLVNFIKRTGVVYATASFSSDSDIIVQTTMSFAAPNRSQPFFAQPYWSVYEGTVKTSAYEIAPIKGTSVAGTYTVNSGFDYNSWAGTPSLVFKTQIIRNAGTSSQEFVYAIDGLYLNYVAGTAS